MSFLFMGLLCGTPSYDEEIAAALVDVHEVFEVPPALVKAIIHTESAFNPQALSRAGAIGLMQVMGMAR